MSAAARVLLDPTGRFWTASSFHGGPQREARRFLRHAVDRLLADQRVGAGIEVEGEQVRGAWRVRVLMVGIHDSDPDALSSH